MAATRTSFAEVPVQGPLDEASAASTSWLFGKPQQQRLGGGTGGAGRRHAVRMSRQRAGFAGVTEGAATSATSPSVPMQPFVFSTPDGRNGSSMVRRAAHRRGRFSGQQSPTANLFGASRSLSSSPGDSCVSMAWSPIPSAEGSGTTTAVPVAAAVQQQQQQQQKQHDEAKPTSQYVAATVAPGDEFARMRLQGQQQQIPAPPAEQLSRLHLGQDSVPAQLRRATAPTAEPIPAATSADELFLSQGMHTQLHVAEPQELPQHFAAKMNLEAAVAAAAATSKAAAAASTEAAALRATGAAARAAAEPPEQEAARAPPPCRSPGPAEGSSSRATFVFSAAEVPHMHVKRPSRSPTPTSRLQSPQQQAGVGERQQAPSLTGPASLVAPFQQQQQQQQQHSFVFRWQPAQQAAERSSQQQQQQQPAFAFGFAAPPAAWQQQQPATMRTNAESSTSRRTRAWRHHPAASPTLSAAATAGTSTAAPPGVFGATIVLSKLPAFAAVMADTPAQPGQHEQPEPSLPADSASFAATRSDHDRNLGNEAFKEQRYQEAVMLYTQAIEALYPHPQLHHRLALLLSNRAAALLSIGQPMAALSDCTLGLQHDPTFVRCALRMASVQTRLGEFTAAHTVLQAQRLICEQHAAAGKATAAELDTALAEIKNKETEVALHEATLLAALQAMGHQLPPPVAPQALAAWAATATAANSTSRVTATEGAEAALRQLESASKGVCHCEAVFAAKALALLHLGRLQEAAAACDEPVSHDKQRPLPAPSFAAAHWRLWVQAQCAFHLGNYSQALQKLDGLRAALKKATADATAATNAPFKGSDGSAPLHPPAAASSRNSLLEAVVVLPSECELERAAVWLNEAQRLRLAGNELIRAGRYTDAIKLYTAALEACEHSATFAAVLHCNRAAAYQAQQAWAHAVADCCRAKALDPSYAKAHSRLAAVLIELRRYDEAAAELEAAMRLPGLSPSSKTSYERRLATARSAARRPPFCSGYLAAGLLGALGGKKRQPHHYRLLGLQRGCSVEEVRRTYKKYALLLHPDKAAAACRFATRLPLPGNGSGGGDNGSTGGGAASTELVGLAEDVRARLEAGASWLFKAAQEAAHALQDLGRRREIDAELAEEEGSGTAYPGGAGQTAHSSYFGARYSGASAYAAHTFRNFSYHSQ